MKLRRNRDPDPEADPGVSPELAHARRVAVHLVLALRDRGEQIAELRRQLEANTAQLAAMRGELRALPRAFDQSLVKAACDLVHEAHVASESMLERPETLAVGALWANLPDTGTRGERKHAG